MPIHNILDIKGKITSQAISDGTWIFLQPLSVGSHSVTFRGNYDTNLNFQSNDDTSFAIPEGWNYETTYELLVWLQMNNLDIDNSKLVNMN